MSWPTWKTDADKGVVTGICSGCGRSYQKSAKAPGDRCMKCVQDAMGFQTVESDPGAASPAKRGKDDNFDGMVEARMSQVMGGGSAVARH